MKPASYVIRRCEKCGWDLRHDGTCKNTLCSRYTDPTVVCPACGESVHKLHARNMCSACYQRDRRARKDAFNKFKVYVVTDGGATKIGKTKGSLGSRIKQLQTGNPREIRIVDVLLCENTEHMNFVVASLHNRYQAHHIRGEWFDISADDVSENNVDLGYVSKQN